MCIRDRLYTETHTKTTNSKGLVNLNIGQGVPSSGSFSGINWALNPKFIKVEIAVSYTHLDVYKRQILQL